MKTPQRTEDSSSQRRLDPFRASLNLLRTHAPILDNTFDKVLGMIRGKDVKSLAGLGQIEDREYHDHEMWSVLALRQIAALFKKNSAFADESTCAAAAELTFKRGERICRITNRRLDYYCTDKGAARLDGTLEQQVTRMQQDIQSLLGDTSDFLGALPKLVRLTNGATEDRTRRRALPFLKITRKIRAPRCAVPVLGRLLLQFGVDLASCVYTSVERNAITLVPKNWKTHRTIAKEPTHSLPVQLALDSHFKRLLRKWGILLSSQEKNQEFAREGSLTGELATIDLEMASDTLSFNTVALLLPADWLALLDAFRSSFYRAPWGDGYYAKFSSMGNGYTFSLETLVFAAACRAVGSRRYAVYGDDIAIETVHVPSLVRLLKFLGFKVNDAKSFYDPAGRFRESCGCDYYKGQLVTPFYLRENPKESDYAGMSHSLNGLIACAQVPGPLWDWCASYAKRLNLRLVPWNEDSRSGVFITPGKAWRDGKLQINRRKPTSKNPNPNYGFPGFKGYTPTQDSRKTVGERSYFLWFLEKNYGGERPDPLLANRSATYLLQMNGKPVVDFGPTATVKSEVIVRTRYVHGTCRYSPKPLLTPSYLFLWDMVV